MFNFLGYFNDTSHLKNEEMNKKAYSHQGVIAVNSTGVSLNLCLEYKMMEEESNKRIILTLLENNPY